MWLDKLKHMCTLQKLIMFSLNFYSRVLVCSECVAIHFQDPTPTQTCCHGESLKVTRESLRWRLSLPWQRSWPKPLLSITQHCAAFCDSETMGRCCGGRHATWAWHRKLLKLHKTNCWALAFPPYRKTISTVIKGELNHLISSKVTEQPPLSPPFPSSSSPSILVLTSPLRRRARWRPPMKCHQISGGVRGHWTKKCSVEYACLAVWKERPRVFVLLGSMDGRRFTGSAEQHASLCSSESLCLKFIHIPPQTFPRRPLNTCSFLWDTLLAQISCMHPVQPCWRLACHSTFVK